MAYPQSISLSPFELLERAEAFWTYHKASPTKPRYFLLCHAIRLVLRAYIATHFRGHLRVHFRCGPVTRDLPKGDLVDRLQSLGCPPPCYPNYGAPDCCPGRFVSC